jgi:hypothetical protein
LSYQAKLTKQQERFAEAKSALNEMRRKEWQNKKENQNLMLHIRDLERNMKDNRMKMRQALEEALEQLRINNAARERDAQMIRGLQMTGEKERMLRETMKKEHAKQIESMARETDMIFENIDERLRDRYRNDIERERGSLCVLQ